ncbi:zinc finger bed domain-containing protein 1-like [Gigaspora margarita]|uniref:Zinc finger bed domain-containing protein 1-like n=1 Tax=Gigaspora margarita TaxID=4874 RepID=A0A8H4B4D4_GIGMA|nr:zinc finger bed domain-containing protein 1-like [Gigaspora margarita]
MWDQYNIRIDEKCKECYKCKACNKELPKNETQLQEHLSFSSFKIPLHHAFSNLLLNKEYQMTVQTVLDETHYCLVSDGWLNINKSLVISYMITTPI